MPDEPITLYRDAVILERAVHEDDERSMWISVSSEEPVERFFGSEILVHDRASVDLKFFSGGSAPLLLDHDHRDVIGVVTDARIENKRLKAKVRFGKSSRASEILDDVRDGIRANVSIGYRIHKTERDEKTEEVRVLKWSPFEVSIVSVPADTSVGVGRARENPQTTQASETSTMEAEMPEDIKNQGDQEQNRSQPAPVHAQSMAAAVRTAPERDFDAEMRQRSIDVAEMYDLAARHNIDRETTAKYAKDKPLSEFRGFVLSQIGNKPLENRDIGLSGRETREFSIMRLCRASRPGATQSDITEAAFEFEAVSAASDALSRDGVKTRGNQIPAEVLRDWIPSSYGQRTLSAGVDTALVPTEHRASSFIDVLRNMASVMRAGPTMLQGLSGNVDIPKKLTASTATWISAEGGDSTVSEPTFGTVSLTPNDISVHTDMTRRMRQQSSPDIESLVRSDITAAMALGIDLAALEGTGATGQPTGVLNTVGISKTPTWAGVNPTWAEIVALETAIADDNALFGNLAYIGRTNMWGAMKTTEKFAGTGMTLAEPGGTTNGYPYLSSNQGTDGNLYFGNWSDLLIGMWGTLDLVFDFAALAKSNGVRMLAFQTIDTTVRHPQSFAYGNDTV